MEALDTYHQEQLQDLGLTQPGLWSAPKIRFKEVCEVLLPQLQMEPHLVQAGPKVFCSPPLTFGIDHSGCEELELLFLP